MRSVMRCCGGCVFSPAFGFALRALLLGQLRPLFAVEFFAF
jgi:hypothetical protein